MEVSWVSLNVHALWMNENKIKHMINTDNVVVYRCPWYSLEMVRHTVMLWLWCSPHVGISIFHLFSHKLEIPYSVSWSSRLHPNSSPHPIPPPFPPPLSLSLPPQSHPPPPPPVSWPLRAESRWLSCERLQAQGEGQRQGQEFQGQEEESHDRGTGQKTDQAQSGRADGQFTFGQYVLVKAYQARLWFLNSRAPPTVTNLKYIYIWPQCSTLSLIHVSHVLAAKA